MGTFSLEDEKSKRVGLFILATHIVNSRLKFVGKVVG